MTGRSLLGVSPITQLYHWNAVDFCPSQQKEKSGQSLSENLTLPPKITKFITLSQGRGEN